MPQMMPAALLLHPCVLLVVLVIFHSLVVLSSFKSVLSSFRQKHSFYVFKLTQLSLHNKGMQISEEIQYIL